MNQARFANARSWPGGSKITRVYVDMVADLFHYGHVNFLRQAKKHGDYLLVGVHADETVMAYKRRPILSMEERVASVKGCRYVDEVVPNAPLTIDRAWINQHNINLVMHGDDFSSELEELCYKVPIEMGIYRTVGYTPGISTTEIIARIKAAEQDL
ncbi:MAG: adenylyltransferase/cytidyltransferase family protein [Dehalococcoidia bacterium]